MAARRVRVWASQFATNDFPPICAMTGAPSETWLKFRFSRKDLPFPFGDWLWFVIKDRVSGRLPLTIKSRRTVLLVRWLPAGLVVGTLALWILGAALGVRSDTADSTVWFLFFLIGVFGLMGGFVGALLVKPFIGPSGFISAAGRDERDFVELRNVHPAFVAAVNQHHAAPVAESS